MTTRTFALIYGIVFLLVGIAGFGVVPGLLQNQAGSGMDAQGMLLGLFHVNGMHNVVHIVFGLWGIAASRSAGGSDAYAKGVAVVYALLAVLGLIPATADGLGMVPLGGNDVWLHAVLALVAAYFGFANKAAPAA